MKPTNPFPPSFSPMLAYNKAWTWNQIRLPVWISIKVDGIRFLVAGGKVYSKQLKLIPNQYIQYLIPSLVDNGVEGELYLEGANKFHDTQSIVMSEEKRGQENIKFCLFDRFDSDKDRDYHSRYYSLHPSYRVCQHSFVDHANAIAHTKQEHEGEGFIVRSLDGLYKHGRCTLREQNVFKLIQWQREEGICMGVTENSQHNERIGALVIETKRWGRIEVGSGFSHAQSIEWREKCPTRKNVTFKYKSFGTKNKPRQPIFVGVRYD